MQTIPARKVAMSPKRLVVALAVMMLVVSCSSKSQATAPTAGLVTTKPTSDVDFQITNLHNYLANSPTGCGPTLTDGVIRMSTVKGTAFCMNALWDGLVVAGAATSADVDAQRVEFDDFLFDTTLKVAGNGGSETRTACIGSKLQIELKFTVTDGAGDSYILRRGNCP